MKERVIIRVLIPECTLEDAVKVKQAIDKVIEKVTGATAELSTVPVRVRPLVRV